MAFEEIPNAIAKSGAKSGWLAKPSRFADWPRAAAVLALLLLALIELTGLLTPRLHNTPSRPKPAATMEATSAPEARDADIDLYENIIVGVGNGETYYSVAARELRHGGYPLRPFVAFRPPLLAELLGHLSPFAGLLMLRTLAAAVMVVWALRLKQATSSPAALTIVCLLLAAGIAVYGQAKYMSVHEIWSGLLVAFSLGLRKEDRWVAAVVVGLLALLIRELALPYVVVMAALAAWDGKRREAAGWAAAIGVFAIATGFHAAAATAAATVADPVSPGWGQRGGWGFFVTAIWLTGPLKSAPYSCAAALAPIALLGWAGWRDPLAVRAFATLVGYAALMMFFGRPDNFYWALMFTPFLMVGLAFAPRSLRELIASARRTAERPDAALTRA
jgi:hypothetical protein